MRAVEHAVKRRVKATKGAIGNFPFGKQKFYFVDFVFRLCFCTREGLFRFALEADRILKETGWLIVQDYFAATPIDKSCHRLEGNRPCNMDYRKLWDWHTSSICYSHQISGHDTFRICGDSDEWVVTCVLQKLKNS